MSAFSTEDAVRWESFSRRLMHAFSLLTVLLSGVTTAISAYRMRALLENSLVQRGEVIASAAARAAFVPLSLEDRAELRLVASYYEGQTVLASLLILDDHGAEWARYSRAGAPTEGLLTVTAPVVVPGVNPAAAPLGRVVVLLDPSGIRARLARQVSAILAFNGLCALAILLGGQFLIGRLTGGMRELARQAVRADELARSNRELEEFAYIASHDLQAPLRRIAGFAQLIEKRYKGRLDAQADDFVDRITAGTVRMQQLIQDLLTYSRAGSRQLESVPTDLNVLLREVVADLDSALTESGGKVTAGPLPVVAVDAPQVSRLLLNLIANAVKFHGERPPEISVSARREPGEWVFSVADNGIGIEPKFTEDVFKMFRRLHAATAYPGTGIGLAVARKIVERHGGRIWVESEPGKGSTFYFTLGASAGPDKEKRHD